MGLRRRHWVRPSHKAVEWFPRGLARCRCDRRRYTGRGVEAKEAVPLYADAPELLLKKARRAQDLSWVASSLSSPELPSPARVSCKADVVSFQSPFGNCEREKERGKEERRDERRERREEEEKGDGLQQQGVIKGTRGYFWNTIG